VYDFSRWVLYYERSLCVDRGLDVLGFHQAGGDQVAEFAVESLEAGGWVIE